MSELCSKCGDWRRRPVGEPIPGDSPPSLCWDCRARAFRMRMWEGPGSMGEARIDSLDGLDHRAHVDVALSETGERLEVVIRLEEDATQRAVSGCASLAMTWLGQLLAYQGLHPRKFRNALLEGLSRRQQAGETYPGLAQELNARAGRLLEEHEAYREALGAALARVDAGADRSEEEEAFVVREDINGLAKHDLVDLLEAVDFNSRSIQEYMDNGLQYVKSGFPMLTASVPISTDKLRYAVEHWRAESRRTRLHQDFNSAP
jgi:hypothetical protein